MGPYGNILIPIRELKNRILIFEKEIEQINLEIASLTQGTLGLALLMCRDEVDSRATNRPRTKEDLLLDTLFLKRSEVQKKVERYKSILAPQNRLPPELIRIIFTQSMEGPAVVPFKANDPPFLFCRISSIWRQLALATPQLWNSLTVATQYSFGTSQVTEIARTLFLRARGFPLSLTTHLPTGLTEPREVDIVWDLIVPLSNNFRKLHLSLSSQQMMRLFAFAAGSLTTVEDFSVTLTDHPHNWIEPLYPFKSTCRLTKAEFYLGIAVEPRILNLPWWQLKKLHFNNTAVTVDQCQDILQLCVSLEDCMVSIQKIDVASFHEIDIVTLDHLESLNAHFVSLEQYELFFRPLLLPSLRNLRLKAGGDRGVSGEVDGLLAFLQRSNCHLERLAFLEWDSYSFDSFAVIEQLPTLRALALPPEHIMSDWTIKKLATGEIGPRLEELKANGKRNLGSVLHMIEERTEASCTTTVSRIRFAHVTCLQSQQTKQASRILKMKALGIDVLLSWAPPNQALIENPSP